MSSRNSPRLNSSQFRFRRHENIGSEGAEEDAAFLADCFYDKGDYSPLVAIDSPSRVVVGRTGAGKSALLIKLNQSEQNSASIDPEGLALDYLSNTSVIPYLSNLGVDLTLFYKLLWRHIFVVELIKLKYPLRNESDQRNFLDRIIEKFFGDKKKKDALDYLKTWGDRFWEDTEQRVHEVTKTLETDVRQALGAKYTILEGSIEEAEKVSVEERTEIFHRCQAVVNAVQIQKLSRIIDILAGDVFNDAQQKYYLIIDRLDERWVSGGIKLHLIRALIETVRDLKRIPFAKIIIALRQDLLDRVFRETRDDGFQEEKYQSLMLRVFWSKSELMEIVNKRINALVRRQYTKDPITWKNIFPSQIEGIDTDDYLYQRTLHRPRDIINFVNCCIELAVDRQEFSTAIIRDAEATYSTQRFRSLADEWVADYPELLDLASILKQRPYTFDALEITEDQIIDLILTVFPYDKSYRKSSYWSKLAKRHYDGEVPWVKVREKLIATFYRTGIVGVRTPSGVSWAFESRAIREAEVPLDCRIIITPMLHRALGIIIKSKKE